MLSDELLPFADIKYTDLASWAVKENKFYSRLTLQGVGHYGILSVSICLCEYSKHNKSTDRLLSTCDLSTHDEEAE